MAVWLITGTSSGFGHELTNIVLKNGDIAVATARRPEALATLTAQYLATADRLLVLKLDVTNEQDVLAAFSAAKAKFGRVDVVVNNAGSGMLGEIESVPDADARAIFETNFWGAARVSREAVRFFHEENPAGAGGRLLQFSSWASRDSRAPGTIPRASSVIIIEPSSFATDALKGDNQPELPAATVKKLWAEMTPSGDARKGMEVVYKLASLEQPPLHFPLGKEAIAAARAKTSSFLADTDKYASWSEGLERDA